MMTSGAIIKYFVIPFVTIIFTVILKVLSRKKAEFTYEDMSVGFEVLIGSTFAVFIQIADKVQKTEQGDSSAIDGIIILLCVGVTFILTALILAHLIRANGWNDANGQPVLKKWTAIYPNIVGAVAQAVVLFLLTNK